MHSRVEAVAFLRTAGFNASERDWALGKTIVVPADPQAADESGCNLTSAGASAYCAARAFFRTSCFAFASRMACAVALAPCTTADEPPGVNRALKHARPERRPLERPSGPLASFQSAQSSGPISLQTLSARASQLLQPESSQAAASTTAAAIR